MWLISDAWNSTRAHGRLAGVYVGVHLAVMAFVQGADAVAALFVAEGPAPLWVPIFMLLRQTFCAAMISALQAILLARLGRSMDRPVWKCRDGREALRRFFVLWFIVNLGISALDQVHANAVGAGAEEFALFLEGLYFFAVLLYLPVAACIMHYGGLEWRALPEALRPMARQIPLTFAVMFLLLGQYAWFVVSAQLIHAFLTGAGKAAAVTCCTAPMAFLEFMAFCAMWRICMIYRQTGESGGDFYDF